MRKLAIALLAVPVLSVIYASTALHRSLLARTGLALGLGVMVAAGVLVAARPAPTTASPPSVRVPLTAASFRTTIATGHELAQPVTIEFNAPMDEASVAAAVDVEPPTAVTLSWDVADRVLTIAPRTHWTAGAYHTVTVDAGALAASGTPLATPARAAFVTRRPAETTLAPTASIGKRVALDTGFEVAFGRPVDPASVQAGITLDPPIAGSVIATTMEGRTRYTFTPTERLDPATTYAVSVHDVIDTDGVAVEGAIATVKTVSAPGVVRFRPVDATTKVDRDVALSVRFTQPMDRRATRAAFKVTADDKAVDGKVSFAEDDTVLVFVPAAKLPYGAKVVMTVGSGARSANGAPLAATDGWFKTVKKPTPAPKKATTGAAKGSPGGSSGGSSGGGSSGGGAVGGGSWASVETYYLGLMNCTRTGGWVTSSGKCSSPGGRNVAALKLDSGISSKVARPYAKKLAVGADCSHFIGGNPGDRLRRAGYTNYTWAENIGCRSGGAKAAVLGSHLFFQSEKPSNGGHYRNLMDPKFDRVGIGVWVSSGRVRLVIDFYHP